MSETEQPEVVIAGGSAGVAHAADDGQMTRESEDPARPHNLWEPGDQDRDHGTHGTFDGRARTRSWPLWADIRRGWLALAGGGLAGLALAALLKREGREAPGLDCRTRKG